MNDVVDFPTFLAMTGNEDLIEAVRQIHMIAPIPPSLAIRLGHLVRIHMATGNYGPAIETWIETHDFALTDEVLDRRLEQLAHEGAEALGIGKETCLTLFKRLPSQVARENTRYHNSKPKDEANVAAMESLILHLEKQGTLTRIRRIDKPMQPVESFVYQSKYKYYCTDTGLFRRMANLPATSVDEGSPSLSRFRGVLSESYALSCLLSLSESQVWYWKSGHQAEVDFVITLGGHTLPVEVKTSRNVKSHSLALYRKLYDPPLALRISLLNLKRDDDLVNVPLYLVGTWLGPDILRIATAT
jgi:predicted AAA+ superfamily ATPase